MATLFERDRAPDSSVATTSLSRVMTPVVSGAAMPSLPACCFTFVGLDSVLWDTYSAAPEERASLIWLVSWLDCIVVEIVADMSPMRANPTSDTTAAQPPPPSPRTRRSTEAWGSTCGRRGPERR